MHHKILSYVLLIWSEKFHLLLSMTVHTTDGYFMSEECDPFLNQALSVSASQNAHARHKINLSLD